MLLFRDTHCHFSDEAQAVQICTESLEKGISGILACASSIPDAHILHRAAMKIPNLFFAAGVHPHEAAGFNGDTSCFTDFQTSGKLRAVGEIGLDFYDDFADHESQISVFAQMLELALQMKLPVSVHCRDKEDSEEAYDIAYRQLKDFSRDGGRFVVHSYSGSLKYMELFSGLGAWFGVNGMITFKKAENIRVLAKEYPAEKILLETDSPYLAPVPHRGKENTPAYIPLIAEALAAVRGISLEEVSELTNRNAADLFSL